MRRQSLSNLNDIQLPVPIKQNVKDQNIQNKKSAIINIKKSGIGEKIYRFAHEQSAMYGLLSIVFAILSGLIAATIFRRV